MNVQVDALRALIYKKENLDVMHEAVMALLGEEGMEVTDREELLEHLIWDTSLDVVGHGQTVYDAVMKTPDLLCRWCSVSAFGAVFLPLEDLEEDEENNDVSELMPSLNYSELN